MTPRMEGRPVDPNGFCRCFDRCDTSLIEEPETCDVCKWFRDTDSRCLLQVSGEEPERSK